MPLGLEPSLGSQVSPPQLVSQPRWLLAVVLNNYVVVGIAALTTAHTLATALWRLYGSQRGVGEVATATPHLKVYDEISTPSFEPRNQCLIRKVI